MNLITLEWSIFLVDCAYAGFFVFTIICLFLRLFRGTRISRQAVNVQYCVNLVLAILTVFDILIWGQMYYELFFHDSGGGTFFLFQTDPDLKGYESVMLASFILHWIGALLFFIPRLRISWLLSLLMLLLMNASFILLLSKGKWDLPTGWSYTGNGWIVNGTKVLAFTILTLIVYLIYYKRKKLPHR